MPSVKENNFSPAPDAFSLQAEQFDAHDRSNPILQRWRRLIYAHVDNFISPASRILELNAGTGIDALRFAQQGHSVMATDASPEMIAQIQKKIATSSLSTFNCKLIPAEAIGTLPENDYDYAFSNFGGLNCIRDLTPVARGLNYQLRIGAYVTWVIMPPICPWEWLRLFKGSWSEATRRFRRNGTSSHIEGTYFTSYYHSLHDIQKALGISFSLVRAESLGIVSAPPASTFFQKTYPLLQRQLERVDSWIKDTYPFNRCGDHIIVTFQKIK